MSGMYALAKQKMMPGELDSLVKLGFSNDEIYKIVAPRRTLARRKAANEQLSVVEADRVWRLRDIIEFAETVFGNAEKAHHWLREPSKALNQALPIELLETETGANIVRDEIGRIRYGMFA